MFVKGWARPVLKAKKEETGNVGVAAPCFTMGDEGAKKFLMNGWVRKCFALKKMIWVFDVL